MNEEAHRDGRETVQDRRTERQSSKNSSKTTRSRPELQRRPSLYGKRRARRSVQILKTVSLPQLNSLFTTLAAGVALTAPLFTTAGVAATAAPLTGLLCTLSFGCRFVTTNGLFAPFETASTSVPTDSALLKLLADSDACRRSGWEDDPEEKQ